jgi:hypothetical protein
MEALIEGLAQYGPLGLWTASLLWMNWQQRKDAEADEQRAAEALRYHQDKIAEKLKDQEILLEKALEKLDAGLVAMKEKYAEDRMLRMKNQ